MKTEHEREFAPLIEFITNGTEFTILTHISPDGDTLGSALAMYMLLTKLGKSAEVICSNPVPKIYSFLPCGELIKLPENAKGCERVISIDCADIPRFGRAFKLYSRAELTAEIDHHITNPLFADVNVVLPHAAATAEIIHELFLRLDMPIDNDVAACLYTGIVTDTGNLSYSNTTPKAVRIIADFIEQGLDVTDINRKIYRTIPFQKVRVQGFVASRIRLEHDGDIGIAVLTRAQMKDFGATNEDCEGIVDCVRDVDCVKIAIFIRESADGTYKVSLRSKSVGHMDRIANIHGGGGHERAAGYTATEPLSTVVANAIEEAVKELELSGE